VQLSDERARRGVERAAAEEFPLRSFHVKLDQIRGSTTMLIEQFRHSAGRDSDDVALFAW
jgi:hypothetical protein